MSQNNLSPLTIPVELEKTVSMYEKFYAKQFSGRKLTWLHHLSNGDIKLGFLPKTYIINMTTFQMSILLLFEKSDNLSYNELKATTKISDDQFPRHVQSLLEAKLLVCNTPVSNQSNTNLITRTIYQCHQLLPSRNLFLVLNRSHFFLLKRLEFDKAT